MIYLLAEFSQASGDAKRAEAKAASKGKAAASGAAADPAKEDAPLQWEASGKSQALVSRLLALRLSGLITAESPTP